MRLQRTGIPTWRKVVVCDQKKIPGMKTHLEGLLGLAGGNDTEDNDCGEGRCQIYVEKKDNKSEMDPKKQLVFLLFSAYPMIMMDCCYVVETPLLNDWQL